MNKKLSINQFLSIFVFLMFLILQIIEAFYDLPSSSFLYNLKLMSFVGILFIIYVVISWKKAYYRFLSPYIVFILLLFACLCGQTPFWMLGIKAGFRDLTTWMHLFTSVDLCKGLLFSYLCLSFMHTVVLLSIDPKIKKTKIKLSDKRKTTFIESKEAYNKIKLFGLAMCVIFIIPYLITFSNLRSIIKTVGYDMQYDILVTGTASLFAKMADFFPLGIITLIFVWGTKTEFNKKNYYLKKGLLILLSIIYIICELLLGQRTGVILFIFALLFVRYKDKNIPLKNMVVLGICGLALMGAMRMVGIARSSDSSIYDKNSNPIVDFASDTEIGRAHV